jgi:hypothetical protein
MSYGTKIDSGFFVSINKEGREINAKRGFASLNERLRKEQTMPRDKIKKQPVGKA